MHKIVRKAVGWTASLIAAFIVAAAATFVPLATLPFTVETSFIDGGWTLPAGLGWIALALAYSMRNHHESRDWTLRRGAAVTRDFTLGMVLAIWPLSLLAWMNGAGDLPSMAMEVEVVANGGSITARGRSVLVTRLSNPETGWEGDWTGDEALQQTLSQGDCLSIERVHGRLGLDFIRNPRQVSRPQPAAAGSPDSWPY